MDRFLASLPAQLRADVERALEEDDARIRLTAVVSRYIDEDGAWPTEPTTTSFLARQFLHQQADVQPYLYAGAGLKATTVAGLAGAGLTVAAGKGAVVLSSNLMAQYWQDTVSYATGIHPAYIRLAKRAFDKMTAGTRWEWLAKQLTAPQGPTYFDTIFGNEFARLIEKELLGIASQSAWRGARSAANHLVGRVADASDNPWVQNYVTVFARNQKDLAERTMRVTLNRGLEQGLPSRVLGERLRQTWALTPRYAQAVENYRAGLLKQDRSPRSVNTLVRRYAERLFDRRMRTLGQSEAMTAFNLGREAQWLQAVQEGRMAPGTMKMWVTAQDELVCPVCRPMDGLTAPLGQPFEGEVATLVPPAHPNCRCLIIPVEPQLDVSRLKVPYPDEITKKLVRVEEYQRRDGTVVTEHFRRLRDSMDTAFWDLTTRALSRGEFASRDELTELMRKKNTQAAKPLYGLRNGRIVDFSTRKLGLMTEGVGFRIGNENHIKTFANKMLAGEDVFRHGRRRDPIMVLVYDDGAQVLDGKHRLAAAQMAGVRKVPVQVARIRKPMPEPKGFRQEFDELRRNLVRWQHLNSELPPKRPKEPFDVRSPIKVEIAFNEWMATRSALRDEERFLEHGVIRGVKPRRFGKREKRVWVKEHTRNGEVVEAHWRTIRSSDKKDLTLSDRWSKMTPEGKLVTIYAGAYAALILGVAATPAARSLTSTANLARLRATTDLTKLRLGSKLTPVTWKPATFTVPKWDDMISFSNRTMDFANKAVPVQLNQNHAMAMKPIMEAKLEILANLAKGGVLPRSTDVWTGMKHIETIMRRYHGSVITNPSTHGMQHAAKKVFGLADAPTVHFARSSTAQRLADAKILGGKGFEPYVKAQYEVTQKMLARQGINEVTVARGMSITFDQARAMGLKPVLSAREIGQRKVWQSADVPLQPLNSFTTDPSVAMQFAKGVTPNRGTVTLVIRGKVPRERVFSNHATGPGWTSWDEWVIKGGTQKWDVVAVDSRLLRNEKLQRQLWDAL
jgi:hypothetical protein